MISEASLVVLGTSETGASEKSILQVSKSLGRPVMVYFDSSANLDERLAVIGCSPVLLPNVVVVASDEDANELMCARPYLPRVVALGNPFLGSLFSTKPAVRVRNPTEVPRIGFLYEPLVGLNPSQFTFDNQYYFQGTSGSSYRMHIAIEEFLGAYIQVRGGFSLGLRLHPKNELYEYEPYLQDFDFVSKGGGVQEFLLSCDLIFGCTSMGMVEAASLAIPTCSILTREIERRWIPTVDFGLTRPFYNRESLVQFAETETRALISNYSDDERTRYRIVCDNSVHSVLDEIMSVIRPQS